MGPSAPADQGKEKTRELETSEQEMEKGLLDHSRNVGFEAQAGLKLFLLFRLSSQGRGPQVPPCPGGF